MEKETGVTWIGGLGMAIAVAISWSVNHGIWWAIWHGFCSWIYVIYYGFGYGR